MELARESAALEVLAVSVNVLGQAVALAGDFATAAVLIGEAEAVRDATGTRVGPYGALVLAALRGHASEASELVAAAVREGTAGGQGNVVQYARWADAVVMNALGRHDRAFTAATQASDDTPELFVSMWSLSELIEAATRLGRPDAAARALARLDEHTKGSEASWALGMAARGRALVAGEHAAEPLYREAIDRLGRTELRWEVARARLLYGEWLRRANRRTAAREELRGAHEAFLAMGADGFAQRARRELRAAGEKVPRRRDERRDELTPQEEQIARLARDGLTNTEIGGQLFLSPRTVEWHLNKVFTKLGIASRRELGDTLDRLGREPAPV